MDHERGLGTVAIAGSTGRSSPVRGRAPNSVTQPPYWCEPAAHERGPGMFGLRITVKHHVRYRWHFSFRAASSSPSNLSNGCFWRVDSRTRPTDRLAKVLCDVVNISLIAAVTHNIQIYFDVIDRFYETNSAFLQRSTASSITDK